MIVNNYQSNSKRCLSFKGVESNIQLGKEAIAAFKREFPKLRSTTKLDIIIDKLSKNPKYTAFTAKLKELRNKLAKDISIMWNHMVFIEHSSYEAYWNEVKALIKKWGVANCEDQAKLVQYELYRKGKQSHIVGFVITDKSTEMTVHDHVYLVINPGKNADLFNPHTWEQEAVIVDPWSGFAKKAQEAIQRYRKRFKFNPETQYMRFFTNK